jgi:polyhydroxybutyrate depolymerase
LGNRSCAILLATAVLVGVPGCTQRTSKEQDATNVSSTSSTVAAAPSTTTAPVPATAPTTPTAAPTTATGPPETTAPAKGPLAGGRLTLQHDGMERSYVVRVPSLVRGRSTQPVPLVVVLHGGGGSADNVENMTQFTPAGEQHGFFVVYPDGTGSVAGRLLTWNGRHCCGSAMRNDVDDVGFIGAMLDDLATRYPIDANRVYVTGMSNGAIMSHRLGAELSDRIAAIAPVVGAVFGDEPLAASPVPAFIVNGALDKSVPPAGGISGGRADEWDGTPMLPSTEQAAFWARSNGCDTAPSVSETGAAKQWRHQCRPGVDVVLTVVTDNGHAWPGGNPGSRRGDTPSTSFDATGEILAFFAAHPKQAR